MARNDRLGELEHIVLLALLQLGEDAYGVSIRREIETRTGREIGPGTIYPTLERLEKKGFLGSRMGSPTAERGGRAKRHFELEPLGLAELRRTRGVLAAMSAGAEDLLDQKV
jgi:DNA-binding PadR family transcriptional regulator